MLVVLHQSGKVAVVRREIEKPVPTEIEEDRSCLAGFSGLERLVDGDADGVRRFRRGNDALGATEEHRRLEGSALLDSRCLDQPLLEKHADQWRGAVVSQAAGVDASRDEGVS